MRFGAIYYAYGFWLLFCLGLFFFWAVKNRRKALYKFAEAGVLEDIIPSVSFRKKIIKSIIIVTVFFLSIFALMRPQWGFQWLKFKRRGLDILIAIDTSKSMLAADVKPNRLERSKLAVRDLIKKLKGDRIGLIAFSGTAFLQCPLTVDYSGFLLALEDLTSGTIPRGGTSISRAIEVGLKSFEGGLKKYKILVIITDGEDHEGNPLMAAKLAKDDGVKIFCIGIGTKEGELIDYVDEYGKRGFLKDKNGNVVKSRLNEEVLQKIALNTGGSYVRSSGAEFGLDFIYEEKLAPLEKREIKAEMSKLFHERFQLPLLLALILLLIEPFISDRKEL